MKDNIIFMRGMGRLNEYSVRNVVKNDEMAVQLAEVYVVYRYGKKLAEEEKPYLVEELSDSWVVKGADLPSDAAGGVFITEINKKDGRVLNFIHGK